MKRLQEETMTKMAVLGRGSMRNKQQVRTDISTIWILNLSDMYSRVSNNRAASIKRT